MDFFGDVFGKASRSLDRKCVVRCRRFRLKSNATAGTSATLIEGLNRVVGDSLSAQEWFATKSADEKPVQLPWQGSHPEDAPYERFASNAAACLKRFRTAYCSHVHAAATYSVQPSVAGVDLCLEELHPSRKT